MMFFYLFLRSRFLRKHDRSLNDVNYPSLHYPEVYLLHGGYKEFYEKNPDHCEPKTYLTMFDPKYSEEMRQFRAKTKTWSGDSKSSSAKLPKSKSRLNLKMLWDWKNVLFLREFNVWRLSFLVWSKKVYSIYIFSTSLE